MKRTKVIVVTVTTEEDAKHHFADLESVINDIVDVYREGGDVTQVVASDSENHLDKARELLEAIDDAIDDDEDDEDDEPEDRIGAGLDEDDEEEESDDSEEEEPLENKLVNVLAGEVEHGPDGPRGEALGQKFHFEREQKILEIEWEFEEDDADLRYCEKQATFENLNSVEYLIGIEQNSDELFNLLVEELRKAGCSERFIAAYIAAKNLGANFICYSDVH